MKRRFSRIRNKKNKKTLPPSIPQIEQSQTNNDLIETLLKTYNFDNTLNIQDTFQNIQNQKDKKELTKALEISEGNENMFRKFSYLLQCTNRQVLVAIMEAKHIYYQNEKIFQLFYEIALNKGKNTIKALIYCEPFYEKNMEKFQLITSLINKSGGLAARKFIDASDIYKENTALKDIFYDMAYHKGAEGVEILRKFKKIFLDDIEKCRKIAELIKLYGKSIEEGLFKNQNIFQKMKLYYDKIDKTIRIIGPDFNKFIKDNKKIFLDEKFLDKFLEITENMEQDTIHDILRTSDIWLERVKLLEIVGLQIKKIHENEYQIEMPERWIKENIKTKINALKKIKRASQNHNDIFYTLLKIKEEQGDTILYSLIDKRNTFSLINKKGKYTIEQYRVLLAFIQKNPKNRDIIFNLSTIKKIIKHDLDRLKRFIKFFSITNIKNIKICQKYIEIYENSGEEKAILFAKSTRTLENINNGYSGENGIYKLFLDIYDKYSDIDINVIESFDFHFAKYNNIFDLYYDIYTNKSVTAAAEVINDLKSTPELITQDYIDIYIYHYRNGEDEQRKNFVQIMKEISDISKILYNDKLKALVKYCSKTLEDKGKVEAKKFIKGLIKLKNIIKRYKIKIISLYVNEYELGGIEKTEEFATAFLLLEKVNIEEYSFLNSFSDIYKENGFEGVEKYIEDITTQSKKIIGPDFPIENRTNENYMNLLENVFPDSLYSNYQKNIESGDKNQHLKKYTYNLNGYPTQLSGLLGYQLKEGKTEDEQLLEKYQKRLAKIKSFLEKGLGDQEKLIEIFEEKIDKLFHDKCLEKIQNMEGLSSKEKLFAIYISLIVSDNNKEIDTELIDLIIMYRYVYLDNMDDYIRYTKDEAKQYKNPISQRYVMWKELSVIYGENLKHNIRNDIFHDIDNSENFEFIKNIFTENIEKSSDFKLKPKQRNTIRNTFENERIEDNKRFEILIKQLIRIFGANIKFQDKAEKNKFEKKLILIVSEIKSQLNYKKFEKIINNLTKLRNNYMFSMEKRIESLFSQDINIIFEEVAKYEEKVSLRVKNYGGDTVKTSIKKRNIIGYFMKTQESTNARMGAHLCISGDAGMWNNPNYFEFVMKDEETGIAVGMTMLLNIENSDGKKYLWFGPNPYESFLDKVSPEKCYNYMHNIICKFAKENNFDGVVIPPKKDQIQGLCTNRGGDFPLLIADSMLKDNRGNPKIVNFTRKVTLSGTYSYTSGALVWEKKKAD